MNPIVWLPDKVDTWQFAGRVRQHLSGQGVIFTPEVGWEFRVDAGNLYRVLPGNGKLIASIWEAMQMDDETLVKRCKEM